MFVVYGFLFEGSPIFEITTVSQSKGNNSGEVWKS
jgi:hypothetical protein